MEAYALERPVPAFCGARAQFDGIVEWLDGGEAAGLTHAELEARLQVDGRELLRRLLQDHLELRGEREVRLEDVVGSDGVRRGNVEDGHTRVLRTVFGEVTVTRKAYRKPGSGNLHPLDAALNLPEEKHSHGLRQLAAIESARGSFEAAAEAVERVTGRALGKKQLRLLVQRGAQDFDAFYEQGRRHLSVASDLLVLSCDGKGLVMRPDALREATRRAAQQATPKLQTRLSKGEKRNRKRMAEVGAVYDCAPVVRSALDILGRGDDGDDRNLERPKARGKWLIASVVGTAREVVGKVFDEAQRRDPEHRRQWIVLVDGHNHQLDCIEAEARDRGIEVVILVDFIHALEYLWKAAWCFFDEGDPAAEKWVHRHACTVLHGRSSDVAGAIRRKATCLGLGERDRTGADKCADYLINKRPYLDYATALERGWPIATGAIEGACRHIVKDRMDITGARWGLDGAEAVLKLRALRSNGDFDEYWRFHLHREHQRVHGVRYAKPTSSPP